VKQEPDDSIDNCNDNHSDGRHDSGHRKDRDVHSKDNDDSTKSNDTFFVDEFGFIGKKVSTKKVIFKSFFYCSAVKSIPS
jgi:hypothetical protein